MELCLQKQSILEEAVAHVVRPYLIPLVLNPFKVITSEVRSSSSRRLGKLMR